VAQREATERGSEHVSVQRDRTWPAVADRLAVVDGEGRVGPVAGMAALSVRSIGYAGIGSV
jgi:hypothetical protein